MASTHGVRAARGSATRALAALLCAVGALACSPPEEFRTSVSLRAFDLEGRPLARSRLLFRDSKGDPVGAGDLLHGHGFRFESEQLAEDDDWGRRVRAVDVEAEGCASRDDRVAVLVESHRIAVGGHPSLSSKKTTRTDLRANLVCLPPSSDEQRRLLGRALREGELRSRIRAAVALGWIRAPADADESLAQAMQDASAIALEIVHHPHPSALPALIDALEDDREAVRVTAAVLLARLGRNEDEVAQAALPALEERRDDPSALVRLLAADAIVRITPR